MIRSLSFASCYVYSPGGESAVSRRSRLLCAMLKIADPGFITRFATTVRHAAAAEAPLAAFFLPSAVLVPVPGCRPACADLVSSADRLALALLAEDLGVTVCRGLRRVRPVAKSATAAAGTRPTVGAHLSSLSFEADSAAPASVVLVDDVVTKGRTLLAAATCLHAAWPHTEIRAFALLRTLGYAAGVERLLEPCVGRIVWQAGDARREP